MSLRQCYRFILFWRHLTSNQEVYFSGGFVDITWIGQFDRGLLNFSLQHHSVCQTDRISPNEKIVSVVVYHTEMSISSHMD